MSEFRILRKNYYKCGLFSFDKYVDHLQVKTKSGWEDVPVQYDYIDLNLNNRFGN